MKFYSIITLVIFFAFFSLYFADAHELSRDVLVKASGPTVYYYAQNGKRYVFPNEGVYYTWFSDFSDIVSITDEQLASMPLGGNVTYRPGIRMVKIQTDPKVYAVDQGGVLRWVTSEKVANNLYGTNWNNYIHDISDAYYINYQIGEPIYPDSPYRPHEVAAAVTTINADKNISALPTARQADTQPEFDEAAHHEQQPMSGVVSAVIDGDTFTLSDGLRIRLIGVNAPEISQPFYSQATAALEDLVLNKTVLLESDASETDPYGRLLKYAYVSDKLVNKEIVLAGLAESVSYPPDTARQSELDVAEETAKSEGRGMWAASSTSDDISIVIFHYNADGNDNNNLEDEYFVLKNDGVTAVDMTGWQVRDSAMHSYTFPMFTLPAGSTVKMVTGHGINTESTIYWNHAGAVWNNDGDSLYLSDLVGALVLEYSY